MLDRGCQHGNTTATIDYVPDEGVEELSRARRPGRAVRDVVISLRVRVETVEAIDKHAKRLDLSRADAIRSLIRRGLETENKR